MTSGVPKVCYPCYRASLPERYPPPSAPPHRSDSLGGGKSQLPPPPLPDPHTRGSGITARLPQILGAAMGSRWWCWGRRGGTVPYPLSSRTRLSRLTPRADFAAAKAATCGTLSTRQVRMVLQLATSSASDPGPDSMARRTRGSSGRLCRRLRRKPRPGGEDALLGGETALRCRASVAGRGRGGRARGPSSTPFRVHV